MEEIGGRTTVLKMEGIQGAESDYIEWLLQECLDPKAKPTDVFTTEAITFMAEKFSTPLQINHYAWKSLAKACEIGEKPVDTNILQEIISSDFHSMEADMKRAGYDMKAICETVDARPAEMRSFFKNRLAPTRAKEIQDEILKIGIAGL